MCNNMKTLLAFLFLACSLSAAQLTITWTAPTTGGAPSAYYLERGVGASPTTWTVLPAFSATTFSYVDTSLTGATTYAYRLRCFNTSGYGAYSPIVSNTTLPDLPGAPGIGVTTPPPAVAINLKPNDRIMISNTTGTVKPNPNDKSMALPAGSQAVVSSLKS